MSFNDAFMLVVRWVHLIASVAWVGGGIFYLVVLGPALRRSDADGAIVNRETAAEFRVLVDVCFFLLLVTGISLTFDRLSADVTGPLYVGVLGLKIALSVWMYLLARRRRQRSPLMGAHRRPDESPPRRLPRLIRTVTGYNLVLILGVVVFLLADLLKLIYENALR